MWRAFRALLLQAAVDEEFVLYYTRVRQLVVFTRSEVR
jgi:hypothetical protein